MNLGKSDANIISDIKIALCGKANGLDRKWYCIFEDFQIFGTLTTFTFE